jgi:hypothetical protein
MSIFFKMNRAIARLILLLVVAAGCETEKDPVDNPLDPSLHLTDGFCLVSNSRVVLNHYDIDYYDYAAHLIYLKDAGAFEEEFKTQGPAAVYADSSRIYDLTIFSHVSSAWPQGPVIWIPFIFYADYTVHIDQAWDLNPWANDFKDPRADTRVVEALKKYGQFRHGLQCEIFSIWYSISEGVILELELRNEDPINYYYWDPAKIGMERYHYVTNGLFLTDELGRSYTHHVQSQSWEGLGMDRMSLLEADSSVILTISYPDFDTLPPGSYRVSFQFPGPTGVENRADLDQVNGRIWLGNQRLYTLLEVN